MATTARTPEFFSTVALGRVTLRVRDLATVRAFYADLLGLAVVGSTPSRIELGAEGGALPWLVLESAPAAGTRPPGAAGLFHTAFLLPDRAALGGLARRLLDRRVRFATGDHGVSEALYLDDPEGNGVELYADRPPGDWPADPASGEVLMDTRAVDLESLLDAGRSGGGAILPDGTRVGHLHLAVSELSRAAEFYGTKLGFPVRQRSFPGAVFLGRDHYHHHLGLNTWHSRRPAVVGALGLAGFTIAFRDRAAWESAVRAATPDQLLPAAATREARIPDPDGIPVVLALADVK